MSDETDPIPPSGVVSEGHFSLDRLVAGPFWILVISLHEFPHTSAVFPWLPMWLVHTWKTQASGSRGPVALFARCLQFWCAVDITQTRDDLIDYAWELNEHDNLSLECLAEVIGAILLSYSEISEPAVPMVYTFID